MDELNVLKKTNKELSSIVKLTSEWVGELQKVSTGADKVVRNLKGGGTLGKGASGLLDRSLASFSGMSTNQYTGIRNYLAQSMPTRTADIVTGAIGNSGRILGGISKMMPDLGATFSQANSAYQGVVASGGAMGRTQFERYAQAGIGRNNATGIGSQVAAATYLAGRGMVMGSATFTQTLKTAGGISQFMGMSNESAAAAVEGLTSGAGSSNLLRNFGIYTSNPTTGKELSTQQIISQITGRLTAGRGKYSASDVQNSLRRGALGVTLQNSGLSADQQSMVVQSLMGNATDSKTGAINFDNPNSLKKATAAMGGNPNAPFMQIYGAKNSAMTSGENSYLTGASAAAQGLSALNDVAGQLASTFGALNSAAGTFMGDNAGQGAMDAFGGVKNIMDIANSTKSFFGGAGSSGGGSGEISSLFKSGGIGAKAAGIMGAVAGGSALIGSGMDAYTKGAAGKAMGAMDWLGAAGSGAMTGASIGTMFGPEGTLIGGLIGGAAGLITTGISNMAGTAQMKGGGGDVSQPASTGVTAAGGNTQQGVGNNGKLSLIPPVNGPLGDRFGAMASYRTHPHRGQDWSVGEGTQVRACAAGTVIATNTSGELGKMVQIRHDGGWITQYCHLSNNNIMSVGDTVRQNDYIANSGNTGTATTGAHLHLALMKGGQYYDPMLYMSGAAGAPAPTTDSTADGASGGSAGGDSGVSGDAPLPVASPSSNAITANASGISGNATSIASQLGATGGGGEGLDKNPLLRKSSEDAYDVMTGKSSSKNNVTINLSIASASESEALKFAKRVKQILEDEKRLTSIGSN